MYHVPMIIILGIQYLPFKSIVGFNIIQTEQPCSIHLTFYEPDKRIQICENVSFNKVLLSLDVYCLGSWLLFYLTANISYFTDIFRLTISHISFRTGGMRMLELFQFSCFFLLETLKYPNFQNFFRGLCIFNFNKQGVIWKLIKFTRFSRQILALKCF